MIGAIVILALLLLPAVATDEPEPVKECAEHCWHSDGLVLTSIPPQYPQHCCKCGAKQTLRDPLPVRTPYCQEPFS